MYLCKIEGEKRKLHTIEQVIDHVQDKTMFEVDAVALNIDLKSLKVFEKVALLDDCGSYVFHSSIAKPKLTHMT